MNLDLSELILAVHASVYERPPWSGFLKLARSRFELTYAGLIFRRAGKDRRVLREFHDSDHDDPGFRQRYRRELYRADPFPYHTMLPGRVYRLPELLGGVDPASSAYYREFLAPAGLGDLLTMRTVGPQSYVAWLTFARDRPDAFTDNDVAPAMSALAPHLTLALRSLARLDTFRIERTIFRRTTQQQQLAAITLDAELLVVSAGARARRLMTRAAGIWVGADGALHLADDTLRRRLLDAVGRMQRESHEWAFELSANPPLQGLLTPAEIEIAGRTPVAILYLHPPVGRPSHPRRPARLVTLFGMTPLEARITDALCDGLTFSEIAAAFGLTEQTVRSYSKSIFAKTGARRQADAVRIVLESVASLI